MYLVAHRGLHSKNTKENTLEAIELGDKNVNVDGVEIDVRLTKDNRVVVIHDETIDRVSDGNGKVRDMTLERLRRFNFGSAIKPSTINTLEETLKRFGHNTLLIIELKDEASRNTLLASKVLEIISKYPTLKIWLNSFSLDIINYLKKYSNRPIGILIDSLDLNLLNLDVDFYSISQRAITYEIVKEKLDNKKTVMVWTIDSTTEMKRVKNILKNNIDDVYIISNNPLIYCK